MSPLQRGRVEMHEFTSRVLEGNTAGDPHVRRVPVYLPPSYDTAGTQRYPVVFLLTGFGSRGRGLLNDNPWSPSIDDRLDEAKRHARLLFNEFSKLGRCKVRNLIRL